MKSSIFYSPKRHVHVYLDEEPEPHRFVVEHGDQTLSLERDDWAFLCLLIGPHVGVQQHKVIG